MTTEDLSPSLFSSFRLRDVEFANRIVVSPMSQYAANDGLANDWHFAHLSRFALGGAGMVMVEATAVEERGRRTPGDLGLWSQEQIEPLARIAKFLTANGSVPAIQLAHAGRKASERRPWHTEQPLNTQDETERGEAAWTAIAPSPLPYRDGWPVPHVMTEADIAEVVQAFANAARRSLEAGFKLIELYAGHGFLLHQFYSPIANTRTDRYGGDFAGRTRILVEVADAIREVWPDHLPLAYRISVTDWIEGGWTTDESVALAKLLAEHGVDLVDCTSGGIGGDQPVRFPLAEGYQVSLAEAVREQAKVATMTVGMIWASSFADDLIRDGKADLVAIARELLDDPNWPLHAARELGVDPGFGMWPPEFGWWLDKRQRAIDRFDLRSDVRQDD